MTIWVVIIGLAITTALVKAAGPVVFGGREPHPTFMRVVAMMAPALLAALIVTSLFADGRRLGAVRHALRGHCRRRHSRRIDRG